MTHTQLLKTLFVALMLFFSASGLIAQTGISAIQSQTSSSPDGTTYTANGAPASSLSGTSFSYRYGASSSFSDNEVSLLSFQAGSIAYRYEGIPVEVFFRRVNNSAVSGERDLMFYFGTRNNSLVELKAPYEPQMVTAFQSNTNLLRGSDNLFANTGDGNGNINNIERLDVVVQTGVFLVSAQSQGFAVMERGAVNQHDPFVVAVITGIDGSGTPTSYSNIIRVQSNNYGNVNVIPNQPSVVLRRNNNSEELKISTTLTGQGIGGVFFNFADFGLSDGQTVYGYSLAGNDFPVSGTPADFVDYTNSTYFPLNTNGGSNGGIDMIALTGIVRAISLSGNVFNDINGLTDNILNGDPLNNPSGEQLYVNLINPSNNNVIQAVPVAADGSYTIAGVPLGNLRIELSTIQGTIGSAAPATLLPDNWVNTASQAGTAAAPQAEMATLTLTVSSENIEDLNFGIQQRPIAGSMTLPVQQNPGADNFFTIPASSFSGNDFDGGQITQILLQDFPIGANALDVDGTVYTSASFPAGGITIPANSNGEPTVSISVDPVDGDVVVELPYYVIDNAGFVSIEAGTVNIPFTGEILVIGNFYPANGYGTLAFEDLWPAKGDYDFNDMVIDYRFELSANTDNKVSHIKATFVLNAFGASYENGFGFQLSGNIDTDDLEVSGHSLTESFIQLTDKGLEAGQSKPTIIVFDNAFNEMPHPGIGIGVNTEPNAPYVAPKTFIINIAVAPNTYSHNDIAISDFNPFIIVNKNRAVEVHLPNYPPTDLADQSMFGQWDDASDAATGKYYLTANNLPWAINIYEKFDWPIEKQDITWVHLKFAEWAISGGVMYPNWYQNIQGFRNNGLIYQVP